jgi:hypothetical protein
MLMQLWCDTHSGDGEGIVYKVLLLESTAAHGRDLYMRANSMTRISFLEKGRLTEMSTLAT